MLWTASAKKSGVTMGRSVPCTMWKTTILEGLENHPMEYDDRLVRQVLECVVVESKDRIKVIFAGGLKVEQTIQK